MTETGPDFTMKCKNCQIEIDDKAIICFRCGAATTDLFRRSVEMAPRRLGLRVPALLGVVFFVVAGFFWTCASDGQATSPMVWVILGVAGALLVYRLRLR
jgi:hypothetical protein